MSDLEVEGQFGDEHVGLQPDLVNTGRGQSYGQPYEAHDGSVAFLGVSVVGVLRPQLPHQQHHPVAAGLEGDNVRNISLLLSLSLTLK